MDINLKKKKKKGTQFVSQYAFAPLNLLIIEDLLLTCFKFSSFYIFAKRKKSEQHTFLKWSGHFACGSCTAESFDSQILTATSIIDDTMTIAH